MGRNNKSKKSKKKSDKSNTNKHANQQGGGLHVDPERIRFQHSRIRPFFSGCGRSVMETLESIRRKEMSPSDLPPIQVIVGPETNDGQWYFSLNNRRLWVLKRCREEGLLDNNQIYVRVRQPKSESEASRYSVENCALEAKIISENSSKKTSTNVNETEDSSKDKQIKDDNNGDDDCRCPIKDVSKSSSNDEIGTLSETIVQGEAAAGIRDLKHNEPLTTPTEKSPIHNSDDDEESESESDDDFMSASNNRFSAFL